MRHDAGVLNGVEEDARSQTEAATCRAAAAETCPRTATAPGALAACHAPTHTRRFHQGSRRDRHLPEISLLVDPRGPDTPVDYRYLYQLVADRAEREEDRGKTLDAKITALLAGVVTFIGFSFRMQATSWTTGAALIYCVPLGVLLSAFMTKRGAISPTAESLVTFFPQYPTTTLRDAVLAMERSCRRNDRANDTKTRRLDVATVMTAVATMIVLVSQFIVALR